MNYEYLNKILEDFQNNNVNFCLIRNYDKENFKKSPDIDILTDELSFEKLNQILLKWKFKRIFTGPFPGHAVYIRFGFNESKFINLDINVGGLARNGILFLPAMNVLSNKIKFNNRHIPSIEDYVLELIFHCIFDKNNFKDEYKKEIEEILNLKNFNWSYFKIAIKNLFPFHHKMIYSLIKQNKTENLLNYRNRFFLERIIKYPKGLLNFSLIYLKRFIKVINPFWNGALIIFVGPEGGGKTYNSTQLENNLLRSAIRSKNIYMGWHEFILPIYKYLSRADKKVFSKKATKLKENRHVIRSHIFIIIYFIELYLRYIFKILPSRKIGIVVINDRYFYDGLYDNNLSPKLKTLLLKIIPHPTICFYLTANLNTLYKRKREVGIENLKTQSDFYKTLSKKIKHVKIQTDKKSEYEVQLLINENIAKFIK